jgi:hypothetical protein
MKRLALCMLALLASVTPKLGLAQTSPACPGEVPYMRGAVVVRIGDDRIRRDYGLTAVDTTHVRLLTDPGDAAVCQRFRSNVNYSPAWTTSDMAWAYYYANGFYFVAGVPTNAGTGHGLLLIFDSSFNEKGGMLL